MSGEFGRIDLIRKAKFQEFMSRVDDMCAPISQSSHSEIVPASPLSVVVILVEWMRSGLTGPYIPVQGGGNRLSSRESGNLRIPAVPASSAVHVGSDGRDIFDYSGFLPGFELEIVCLCMTALKLCREVNSHKDDSIHDAVGYLGLLAEIEASQGKVNPAS